MSVDDDDDDFETNGACVTPDSFNAGVIQEWTTHVQHGKKILFQRDYLPGSIYSVALLVVKWFRLSACLSKVASWWYAAMIWSFQSVKLLHRQFVRSFMSEYIHSKMATSVSQFCCLCMQCHINTSVWSRSTCSKWKEKDKKQAGRTQAFQLLHTSVCCWLYKDDAPTWLLLLATFQLKFSLMGLYLVVFAPTVNQILNLTCHTK